MLRYLVLAIALLIFVIAAVSLLLAALIFLALACVVGVPLYLIARPHFKTLRGERRGPVDRLKELYADGKIDLFEFERRVAKLISVGH